MSPETSIAGAFGFAFETIALTATTLTWPNRKYELDPVGFARDILGICLWAKQIEIALCLITHRKISVRSGHRVGKSLVCAVIALWYYCTFEKARVFLTAPTLGHVQDVLWREIQILVGRAGTCLSCRQAAERANPDRPDYPRPCPHSALIDGYLHENAEDGLQSSDHREIKGHTADKPEALQGRASPRLLYICDEASGIKDATLRVVQSNLAGQHARSIYISNPTQTTGIFYESQTSHKDQYKVIHISSLDVIHLGIEGLASKEWAEETAELSGGTDSAEYIIRVLGNFAPEHTQKVIPRSIIDNAVLNWATTPEEGPLHLGVDVARFGDDDTAIAVRRGKKIIELIARNGLDEHGVTDLVLETADRHRTNREIAIIKLDRAGVGIPVEIELHKRASRYHRIVGLHPGSEARLPEQYALLRDQLWFSLAQWLREGGAIPDNERLLTELHSPVYSYDARNRRRVESKDITRKKLKRSPDLADACLVAGTLVWTNRGQVPIESVTTADLVMTRMGWRSVLRAHLTYSAASVFEVVFEDGTTLVGTGNHPIWTEEYGFTSIDTLPLGVRALLCTHSHLEKQSISTASNFGVTPNPGPKPPADTFTRSSKVSARKESALFTESSGLTITDRSLTDTTFTISTETHSTTISRISRASPRRSTYTNTTAPSARSAAGNSWIASAPWPLNGTVPLRAELGTRSMESAPGTIDSRLSGTACTAASPMTTGRITTLPSFAPELAPKNMHDLATESRPSASSATPPSLPTDIIPARLVHLRVAHISESGIAAVFNLEIEGAPEYFANGILVHNCGLAVWDEAQFQSSPLAVPRPGPYANADLRPSGLVYGPGSTNRNAPVYGRRY